MLKMCHFSEWVFPNVAVVSGWEDKGNTRQTKNDDKGDISKGKEGVESRRGKQFF